MTCREARDLFSALVDDALDLGERQPLDAHLADCPECRRELERFRAAVGLVRDLQPVRAPVGFAARVLAAAQPVPWWRRLARGLLLPLPVKLPLEVAAIALVGVIVSLLYRQTPDLERAARVDTPSVAVEAEAPTGALAEAPEVSRGAETGRKAVAKSKPVPPRADDALERKEAPAVGGRLADRDVERPREPSGQPPESRARAEGRVETFGQTPPAVSRERAGDARRASGDREATIAAEAVVARLTVADPAAAEREIASLVGRLAGAGLTRRVEGDRIVLEVAVPRAAWPELLRGLERLGRLTPALEPRQLPDPARLTLTLDG